MADYCVYQDRSHFEAEQKLKDFTGLSQEEKGEVLIWLIQNNFLNEERFARSYARGKFYQKNWGKIKILQGLKQKHIPDNLIQQAMKEIKDEDYYSTLKRLASKKWETLSDDINIFAKKKKLASYLSQKGYENFLIYDLLNDF